MTLNIGTLVGYLELNDTQLNRKADAATKKIDGLMLHLKALAKNNPKLNIDVQTKQLEQAAAEIEALKAEGAKGVDVNVRMVAALAKLDALQTKLREMHNAEIKVHVDDRDALAQLDAIQAKASALGSKGGLLGSALAFGPAFLPMLNAIPGGLLAIGSGAVASASGVGVLALAFHGLGDSVKAYQDYEAKLPFAKNAKQVAELKKQLALSAYGSQTDSGRDFTRLVATKGAKAASGIKSSAQAGVFPGATKALRDILPLVPTVERLMKSLGTTVGEMTDETAKALNSPFWRQWFVWLGEDAKTQLPLVGSIFGHFFTGLMRGIQRFSPMGTELLKWFDNMMVRFDHWTGSPAFDDFMANTATNAHAVMDALRPFGKVFGEFYAGLSGAGLSELQVFGEIMTGLGNLPVGALHAIGALLPVIFLGLKGIGLTSSIVGGVMNLGRGFTFLRGEMSATQTAVSGLVGAAGLGLLVSGLTQADDSTRQFQTTLGGMATGFAIGGPVGGAVGALAGFVGAMVTSGNSTQDAKAQIVDYGTALDSINGKLKRNAITEVISSARKSDPDAFLAGSALGFSDKQIAKAIMGNKKVQASIKETLRAADSLSGDGRIWFADSEKNTADAVTRLRQTLFGIKGTSEEMSSSLRQANKGLIANFGEQAAKAKEVSRQLQNMKTQLDSVNNSPARPRVDSSSIDIATGKAATLLGTIRALSSAGSVGIRGKGTGHVTSGTNVDGSPDRDGNPKTGAGRAAGGTVAGQRMPYGDKVLTPTAPGEEIISNSHGQADMNREALKAANAGARIGVIGYAGGGTVDPLAGFSPSDVPSGTSGHHGAKKKHHGRTHKQILQQQLTRENKALAQTKQMLSDAQSWSQAFGGNVFGADLSAYMPTSGPTTSMVNGMMVTQSGGPLAQSPQNTLLAMLAYQNAQKAQAANLSRWVAKLRKEGVSKGVLDQMQAGGAAGIAQIQALASGSLDQVRQFNSANTSTAGLLNNTGALATSGMTYSALQQQQMEHQRNQKMLDSALHGKPIPVRMVSSSIRP